MREARPYQARKLLTATLGLAVVSHLGTTACGGQTADSGTGGSGPSDIGTGSYTSGNLVGPPGGGGDSYGTGGGGGTIGSGGVILGSGAFTSGNLVGPPGGAGGTIECVTSVAGQGGENYCDPEVPQ